jgi:hypothetical protein
MLQLKYKFILHNRKKFSTNFLKWDSWASSNFYSMSLNVSLSPHIHTLIVPHSKSGVVPMSSLLGIGQLGSGKLERVE